MASVCCLVGAAPQDVSRLAAALEAVLGDVQLNVALLDIVMLHALAPEVLVIDFDTMKADPYQALRHLRFGLPHALLVVFASALTVPQMVDLRDAGMNALVAKDSTANELEAGLRIALTTGIFVDAQFADPA